MCSTSSRGLRSQSDALRSRRSNSAHTEHHMSSREESTEDEDAIHPPSETEAEARERMAAENKRKREAKEVLTNPPPPPGDDAPVQDAGAAQDVGGWTDAAWLLSVASKALF